MARRAVAGSGALLIGERESPVTYDLFEVRGRGGAVLEGAIFGDADVVRYAFLTAEHRLRLADGEILPVLLLSAGVGGVADVRALLPEAA
jgi:hypothetical protein